MYINFNKLLAKNISPVDLVFLQAAHQQRLEDLEGVIATVMTDESLDKMVEGGYVTQIKGKKGDSEIARLRSTKKGRDFLLNLQKLDEWEEQDITIANWVEDVCKKKPNYIKSNMAQLKRNLFFFRFETGIHGNRLAALLKFFLENTYIEDPTDRRPFNIKFNEYKEKNPKAQISNIPANIIWAPKDRYQKYMSLEQSNLWSFYQEYEDHIERVIWKNIKE
jgi:hypothetical protein